MENPKSEWDELVNTARNYCQRAYSRGAKVGAAALSSAGTIYGGCNIQHRIRSHDIHAEVNAISTMVAQGCIQLIAISVVVDGELLTPCGACLDWIIQFGGRDCIVVCSTYQLAAVRIYRAYELMPHHPLLE